MTYDNLAAKLNSQNWDLDLTTAEARQAATFLRRAADVQRWATEPWSQAAAEGPAAQPARDRSYGRVAGRFQGFAGDGLARAGRERAAGSAEFAGS